MRLPRAEVEDVGVADDAARAPPADAFVAPTAVARGKELHDLDGAEAIADGGAGVDAGDRHGFTATGHRARTFDT